MTPDRGTVAGVPLVPLLLGLAGVLPFAWGALGILLPALGGWSLDVLGPRYTGRTLLLLYGTVILSFMSGTIWGYAMEAAERHRAVLAGLSTLPALWAVGLGFSAVALAVGFVALLALDLHAQRAGLAPRWWMRLRLLLTVLVVPCLLVGLP